MLVDFVLFNGKDARIGLSEEEAKGFAKELMARGWEFKERTSNSMDIALKGEVVGRVLMYDRS